MTIEDKIKEFQKCKDDPIYFINTYVKCASPQSSQSIVKLYDYQEDIIRRYHNNRFTIVKGCRQSGKSFTGILYILHYILFNENVIVGLFSHNRSAAVDLLTRLSDIYLELPSWMRMEVIKYNKTELELGNGSKICASSVNLTSAHATIFDLIFLDEFAFVNDEIAGNFWEMMIPTVFSRRTKLIVSSTPFYSHKLTVDDEGNIITIKVPTLFYVLWIDAIFGRNTFIPYEISWRILLPEKDEQWKEKQIAYIGKDKFDNEYECKFLDNVSTSNIF
jgi:hypothetical protein